MNVSLFSWIVILLAALAANLPFFNQQLFGLIPLSRNAAWVKPVWVRLLELVVLYFLVGLVARQLEAGIGNLFSQGWEFYAITGCLFLVLAYPGYVMRYLRKQHA
ncbi:DUF2818 family protein [Herbaspirillum rubrisubalbicans]|uniref:DUF2818 domain-containing protein n=1 Tax=Herbaspirillum rubrisubalbicans TaxID=80842 RepID=A0AAD0XFY4_9BURK|nr:DUF2818 family protein [Herbaspirillum rubrisubalbicans]ALU88860.1 hypothetical protein Hrubri_1653 [Herbaspirillum rubrisubalbicans M1]AYR23902.1 DUF2818 domain-containing protein [Herbaspirillum rubrisubalbicans]NQE48318.1 membrane protein [Herbaspirillum rubrisubalbicans]